MTDTPYFLSKADIDAHEGQIKKHFLNENAVAVCKPLADITGLTGVGISLLTVEPGAESTEFHFHYREDECVYVLSGKATARVGDDTFEINAGDFIAYRKGGLPHAISNTGTEPLCMIVVGERGDTDIVDYPEKGKRMFRTKGLDWNVMDMADIKDRK